MNVTTFLFLNEKTAWQAVQQKYTINPDLFSSENPVFVKKTGIKVNSCIINSKNVTFGIGYAKEIYSWSLVE